MTNMKRICYCNNLISIILESIPMINMKQLFITTNMIIVTIYIIASKLSLKCLIIIAMKIFVA